MELNAKLCLLSALILCARYAASRVCRPAQTTLATFNTALLPSYPGQEGGPAIEERVSLLIEQIEASDVDILCLQEVFFADVQQQIYQNLSQAYPYVHSSVDFEAGFDSETPACTLTQLQQFEQCAQENCPDIVDPLQFQACVVLSCGNLAADFGQQCADCISLYQPSTEGIAACLSVPANRFQTSFGLMLLSRRELTDTQASRFIPQNAFRGYLRATVADVGTVFCTHLTAVLSNDVYIGPPIPAQYSNYEEQQFEEITTLFEQLNGVETPILLGDFNHGPASQRENVVYELPFHYGLMTARGYVSPYVLLDGRCTFCTDNPAVNFPSNLIIDHVYLPADMYKGRVISSQMTSIQCTYQHTEPAINCVLCLFAVGLEVKTATGVQLSDHFGVKVTLKDVRSRCRWWEEKQYFCPAAPPSKEFELPDLQPTLKRLCVVTE